MGQNLRELRARVKLATFNLLERLPETVELGVGVVLDFAGLPAVRQVLELRLAVVRPASQLLSEALVGVDVQVERAIGEQQDDPAIRASLVDEISVGSVGLLLLRNCAFMLLYYRLVLVDFGRDARQFVN